MKETEWTATDSDDNAESNATKAAVTGQRHVITGVAAGYATAPATAKLLQLKRGTTVIWSTYLTTAKEVNFPSPIRGNLSEAVTATLAASGTGGVVSQVTLMGYTIG